MIVRNFLSNPEMPFDFYSDYSDTMRHLAGIVADSAGEQEKRRNGESAKRAAMRLEARHNEWVGVVKQRMERATNVRIQRTVRVRDAMLSLTEPERLEVIHMFCSGCGAVQPEGRGCQCLNDE